MDVQQFGATLPMTDLAVLTPMAMDTRILMLVGLREPIVTVLMHSRTTRHSGAMRTTMDSEATPMETTLMIVRIKQEPQQKIRMDVLTGTVMVIPTQEIHSLTMEPNGRIQTGTITVTTWMETIQITSQMMLHNGVIPMATDTVTIRVETTATDSRTIRSSGLMPTTMDMETTS